VRSSQVAAVCVSQILTLTGYSAVPALLPQFVSLWSLNNTQAGWLAGTFFIGYMAAVLPLVALTDRIAPRRIYLLAAAMNVAYYFTFASAGGWLLALAAQLLGGIALAGLYMPGLRSILPAGDGAKPANGQCPDKTRADGGGRARTVAWYTSSFTIGASLSFLFAGRVAELVGWRSALVSAGLCAVAALAIAAVAMPSSAASSARAPTRLMDLPTVLRNRQAMAFMIGYIAVIWSASGLRNWIVLLLSSAVGGRAAAPASSWITLGTATLVNLLGVPAALLGNELAIRFGLRRTAGGAFILATVTAGLFGFTVALPSLVVCGLALLAAVILQLNFANLTTGLLAAAEPTRAGLTVALYSFLGFAGSFLGPLLFGWMLDRFGGAHSLLAWGFAYGSCGLAALVGGLAMLLERIPLIWKHTLNERSSLRTRRQ
jgi:MFS family permease